MNLSNLNQKENSENISGGSYRQVRNANTGGQVHHMPADSVSPIDTNDGPGIWMTTPDHQRTGSWGRRPDRRAYRDQQKQLIDTNGWDGYKDAIQMDIDDLHKNFGDKYDQGINQALAYVQEHESELKQKFADAINAKETASLVQKPESSESTSGDQVNETLPAQKSVEITLEERDRLNQKYAPQETSQPTNELTEEEPTKS